MQLPCSHHPITLRRPPNPRHLQPGPHHGSRERADTLPPAVDEAKRQALHGGVYGYDIYAAFSVCIGPSFTYSREFSLCDEGYKGGGGGGKGEAEKGKKKKKGSLITILSADVIFPILFILHEIEYRDKLDSMDAREAEWEEDEIQILLQLDHGAAVVGVDGDVCSNIIVQFRGLSLGGDCDGR